MDPRDLVKIWDAPDNSKLTPKQWSVRLPIHVAAKINALCDLYPRRSKTEIIGDLLATAIDMLIEALPREPRSAESFRPGDGMRERFEQLTRHYVEELEGKRHSD